VQFKPSYSGALTSAVEALAAVRNGVVPVGLTAASFSSGAMPALGYLEAIGGLPTTPIRCARRSTACSGRWPTCCRNTASS
jgi:hypothetical protein